MSEGITDLHRARTALERIAACANWSVTPEASIERIKSIALGALQGTRAQAVNVTDILEEIDAVLDQQVYGLNRSSSDAYGKRDADIDLPAEYEHDVVITEALWDKIRKAISERTAP